MSWIFNIANSVVKQIDYRYPEKKVVDKDMFEKSGCKSFRFVLEMKNNFLYFFNHLLTTLFFLKLFDLTAEKI